MNDKIILFLSPLKADSREIEYRGPNRRIVTGMQTNEAPVKYLLESQTGIQEILCITTPKAKESAWDHFVNTIANVAPTIPVIEIPFHDREESFTEGPLERILNRFTGSEDRAGIYLDTTGGTRNNVFQLVLISQVLRYRGIPLRGAVYSNFNTLTIEDVTADYLVFDLVNGLNELTSFGSVRTLEKYRKAAKNKSEGLSSLTEAMKRLNGSIALCRTDSLDEQMKDFNQAVQRAKSEENGLLKNLIPAFQDKFGSILTIPSIIRWCAKNEMIQQALTIYTEKIPAYLIREAEILTVDPGTENQFDERSYYKDPDAVVFQEGFLRLSEEDKSKVKNTKYRGAEITTLCNLEYLLPGSPYQAHIPVEDLCKISQDYLYMKAMRNQINHANSESTSAKGLVHYLKTLHYDFAQTNIKSLQTALYKALDRIESAERKVKEGKK